LEKIQITQNFAPSQPILDIQKVKILKEKFKLGQKIGYYIVQGL